MDVVLRATAMFAIVFVLLRLLGKRELGQLAPFELVTVNRRSIGTPCRRAKGTPLQLRGSVDAGRGFRAAGGAGRA